MKSLANDIDYFVYLAQKGVITDSIVREYYRKRLVDIFRTIKLASDRSRDYDAATWLKMTSKLIVNYHRVLHRTYGSTEFLGP